MKHIGIIGAGAWGTALALVASRAGRTTLVWAFEREVAADININHRNEALLPGIELDPSIRATGDLAEAAAADIVLLTVPAQFMRGVVAQLAPRLRAGTPLVICAKGIEVQTGALMSEVVAAALPRAPCAVLSGPTFADEIARGLPAAATLACTDTVLGRQIVEAIGGSFFRPYLADDPIGAQVGGAVKNTIAIGCGIVTGRRLGHSARAALITRGLAEMARLAVACGGRAETMMGLSGIGDLTLTCNAEKSRNYALGVALGQGKPLAELLAGRRSVVEGVYTAAAVVKLARRIGIEVPISAAVNAILHEGAAIDATIEALLARPFRSEGFGAKA